MSRDSLNDAERAGGYDAPEQLGSMGGVPGTATAVRGGYPPPRLDVEPPGPGSSPGVVSQGVGEHSRRGVTGTPVAALGIMPDLLAPIAEPMARMLGPGRLMILDRSATVAVLRDTQWQAPAGAPTFPMIGVPGEH